MFKVRRGDRKQLAQVVSASVHPTLERNPLTFELNGSVNGFRGQVSRSEIDGSNGPRLKGGAIG
jgi:hypothetical protein